MKMEPSRAGCQDPSSHVLYIRRVPENLSSFSTYSKLAGPAFHVKKSIPRFYIEYASKGKLATYPFRRIHPLSTRNASRNRITPFLAFAAGPQKNPPCPMNNTKPPQSPPFFLLIQPGCPRRPAIPRPAVTAVPLPVIPAKRPRASWRAQRRISNEPEAAIRRRPDIRFIPASAIPRGRPFLWLFRTKPARIAAQGSRADIPSLRLKGHFREIVEMLRDVSGLTRRAPPVRHQERRSPGRPPDWSMGRPGL